MTGRNKCTYESFSVDSNGREYINQLNKRVPLQRVPSCILIGAVTCNFQQCGILTSVDTDEPVQPPLSYETSNNVPSVA